MTILDQLKKMLMAFFGARGGSKDPVTEAKRVIQQQRANQKRLKESLIDLIFQRKKFEAQLQLLENKRLGLKEDVEMAAARDRDSLALRLMEELDLLVKEIEETSKNLNLIQEEVETAKQVEVELAQQLQKSESQLSILVSRSQSVQMREELQEQFSKIHQEIGHLRPGLNGVEESILKLESRLETLRGPSDDWKKEVVKMRKERTDHFRKSRLEQLKLKMKGRQLPGRVVVPEIIPQTH